MISHEVPPFRPHPLVPGGHAQTLVAYYVKPARCTYAAMRHTVQLDDGDAFILHDDCPEAWRAGDRIVLLVPGLDGSYE